MLEKNVQTFSQHLEELNLKNTAEAFKREFLSKPNDAYELGKYNILKHLQKELNKCTGTNTSTDYSPTSARKKIKQENPIFMNLIAKISKREKEKKEESKNEEKEKKEEKSIDKKSKLFLHLSSKIKKQFESEIKEKNKKNIFQDTGGLKLGEFQDLMDKDDGYGSNEDLPMFGSAVTNMNKKKKPNEDFSLQQKISSHSGDINAIIQVREGYLVYGTSTSCINVLSEANGSYKQIQSINLKMNVINCIKQLKDNRVI